LVQGFILACDITPDGAGLLDSPPLMGRMSSLQATYFEYFTLTSCKHGSWNNCTSNDYLTLEQKYIGECAQAKVIMPFTILLIIIALSF